MLLQYRVDKTKCEGPKTENTNAFFDDSKRGGISSYTKGGVSRSLSYIEVKL